MSMTPSTSETSVTFSLAELAKIEQERVRDEDTRRAQANEKEARERREAGARRREAEAAQLAADTEARARRVREEAIEKARAEAREQAALQVGRIEAEARARLEADNAARAHELAVLRVRTEGGRRRVAAALAVALGLALCGGGAAAFEGSQRVAALEQEGEHLREGQRALGRERAREQATELATLDRRYAALRARPLAGGAEEARVTTDAARGTLDAKNLDHDRMRAFGDALDAFQARVETLERLAALDRRKDDLAAWAADRRQLSATAAVRSAAARAKLTGEDGALRAYEVALDQLRDTLAQAELVAGRPPPPPPTDHAVLPCKDGDPGCGLDGKRIF
jgi:hypothetical protein